MLGLRLAHDHPELLYAYIGVGQATNAQRNEEVLYQETLAEARRTNNQKAIKELMSIAPYPSGAVTFKQVLKVREWSGTLIGPAAGGGEGSMGREAGRVTPEYTLENDVDWFRGQLFSVNALLGEMSKTDLADLGYEYRTPIFFLEGRRDPYTPSSVAKEFFDKMKAPAKTFEWFEKSGHFPF